MNHYGERYLTSSQFSSYCSDLNSKLLSFNEELELYEQEGVLLPVARVLMPEEYLNKRALLDNDPNTYGHKIPEWESLERIFYRTNKIRPVEFELWNNIDLEVALNNKHIIRPSKENFKKWNSYKVKIPNATNGTLLKDSSVHLYHYYQVHQIYAIQKNYPLFARHNWILKNLKTKEGIEYLKPTDNDAIVTLSGNILFFEALSFYIELFSNERRKTFSIIPEKDGVKTLNDQQFEDYKRRVEKLAKIVFNRFSLSDNDFYKFILYSLKLHTVYEADEKFKLSNELMLDIRFSVDFFSNVKQISTTDIEKEIKILDPTLVKKFRHTDKALEVYDYARETLERIAVEYNVKFPGFEITGKEIEKILDFMNDKNLFIVPNSIYEIDKTLNAEKAFKTNSLYTGLTNFSIGLECFLRDIANIANLSHGTNIEIGTLHPLIKTMFSWGGLFNDEHRNRKNMYTNNSFLYLEDVYTSQNLDEIIKTFLLAHCARNLVAHNYILDQYLYRNWYGKIYVAICDAIFYSWVNAKNKNWI